MSDFYLGRGVADSKPLLYESRDLVTHGVCVGMTGSGKTAADIEKQVAAVRGQLEAEGARRETVRAPVNRADVRALEWYVLWS